MLTIFFMLLGLSNAGIGNFGVVALMGGYGVTFSAANLALTAFSRRQRVGVLAGGFWPTAPRAMDTSPRPASVSTRSSCW